MNKWTDQQKLLHQVKLLGGAENGLKIIQFALTHGMDRVIDFINETNQKNMGINNAINLLSIANKLGPKNAIDILQNELMNKNFQNNETNGNIINFRRKIL